MTLTARQLQELENYSTVGTQVRFDYEQTGTTEMGEVVDEVSVIGGRYKSFIQLIKPPPGRPYEDGSEYAYRFCYYTYTEKGIRFTPYSLFVSSEEHRQLAEKARAKGWRHF